MGEEGRKEEGGRGIIYVALWLMAKWTVFIWRWFSSLWDWL